MSTITYAKLTTLREDATREEGPGFKTYVDALAALVPAEVMALHAAILSATATTVDGKTEITAPGTLSWAFLGLVLLSIGIYVGFRALAGKWVRLDLLRMFIPPLAFIGWTMLQKATAFDAAFPKLGEAERTVIALFLAVILGVAAGLLAYKAPQRRGTST